MAAAFEVLATDNLLPSRSRDALDRHLTDTLDVGGIAIVTGEAGAGKTAAVRAFQSAHGLKVTGTVDAQTYQALGLRPLSEDPSLVPGAPIPYAESQARAHGPPAV